MFCSQNDPVENRTTLRVALSLLALWVVLLSAIAALLIWGHEERINDRAPTGQCCQSGLCPDPGWPGC